MLDKTPTTGLHELVLVCSGLAVGKEERIEQRAIATTGRCPKQDLPASPSLSNRMR